MNRPAHLIVLAEERRSVVSQIDVSGTLLWEGMLEENLIGQSQLTRIKDRYHSSHEQAMAMLDHLSKNEDEEDFEKFLSCLEDYDHRHVAKKLRGKLKKVKSRPVSERRTECDVLVLPESHNAHNFLETAAFSGVLNEGPLARVINPNRVYDIDTEAKGRVLIINYTQTTALTGRILYREGCQHDVDKMRSIFRHIGFHEVEVYQNLNRGNLITTLRDFARSASNDNTKSVFVVIMAHGGNHQNRHYICTQDGDGIFIEEEIRQIFDSKEVPNLAERPKIFIIQACRGVKDDVGEFVEPAEMETDADGVPPRERVKVPSFSDYLFAFSTQPNHVSYRDTATGSPYLQELDYVFREESSTMHVADMLTVVRNNFIRSQERRPFIQSPEMLSGMNKFFYIYPERLQNNQPVT